MTAERHLPGAMKIDNRERCNQERRSPHAANRSQIRLGDAATYDWRGLSDADDVQDEYRILSKPRSATRMTNRPQSEISPTLGAARDLRGSVK